MEEDREDTTDEEQILDMLLDYESTEALKPRRSDWDRTCKELEIQIKAMKQQLTCTVAMYAAAKVMKAIAPGPKEDETDETPKKA